MFNELLVIKKNYEEFKNSAKYWICKKPYKSNAAIFMNIKF